jgi:hypothetical protein
MFGRRAPCVALSIRAAIASTGRPLRSSCWNAARRCLFRLEEQSQRSALMLKPALAALLAASVSLPAYAQNEEAESALASAFMAEHEVWEEDHDRWMDEHDKAIDTLRAAIERLEGESMLDRHVERMEEHREALEGDELAGLVSRHARARSQHEELREAHHHLMDVVALLQRTIDEDMGMGMEGMPEEEEKSRYRRRNRN